MRALFGGWKRILSCRAPDSNLMFETSSSNAVAWLTIHSSEPCRYLELDDPFHVPGLLVFISVSSFLSLFQHWSSVFFFLIRGQYLIKIPKPFDHRYPLSSCFAMLRLHVLLGLLFLHQYCQYNRSNADRVRIDATLTPIR